MPYLDLRVDCGVPGWIDDTGRHVRLADIATPDRIAQHRTACVLITLALAKLTWELIEATHA